MKISLICIGKTDDKYIEQGIEIYTKRLKHYCNFQIIVIPDIKNVKNLTEAQQKEKESQLILKNISNQDYVMLLDERGKEYSSIEFSSFLEKQMVGSVAHIVLVIGGPYGFDQQVYDRANAKLSLSRMTFSHQMVRLFFVEQLYRAHTIMRGEPYHHE
ncbi:23S rRNA (pseudouridine(1915)-N(3))-methyltransferase RlmH [Sphingobacterium sp. DK4209]|uniref:Ribosomal RNA large subunit methyltransferase H n=1 Tax=Sphingobacterium zhuxiongii TaxID=2662364 RepID=A0A5Q0Q8H2_9SPHI|nr:MULTISPECIES: 23S rRNA (pseudouridine(1915)-N(3))-methyltransferase RlmH [unclassified Sphingobacterium]MVZ64338.1 23S rRNA (pseudouridine(1915)-N(3))-methyltransferase RlmH [Sphingobacterium sp. DK4209]QGA25686.1 23S rRNA (pseudouridine(1915)-N(3))-methyltransferase RlmH [Sphingobacterium sp. dk4302]